MTKDEKLEQYHIILDEIIDLSEDIGGMIEQDYAPISIEKENDKRIELKCKLTVLFSKAIKS